MDLYFKKDDENSLIKLTLNNDRTYRTDEYDIETRTDLEAIKKDEIKTGEHYDPDTAECDGLTLEECQANWEAMDIFDYFVDFSHVATLNSEDYFIQHVYGGANLYNVIDFSKVYLSAEELIQDVYKEDK